MEEYTKLYYTDYSVENGAYIGLAAYVKTEELKYNLGFYNKPNYTQEEFNKRVIDMSSEEAKEYVEEHGCYGVFVY